MQSKAWCIAMEFVAKTEGLEGEQAAANLKELLCESFEEYSLPMKLSVSTLVTRTAVRVKVIEPGLYEQTVCICVNGQLETYHAQEANCLTQMKARFARIPEVHRIDDIAQIINKIDAMCKRKMQKLPGPRVVHCGLEGGA